MKFNKLGNTDIEISQLTLGTMIFGEQIDQADSFRQMDLALENQINTFDTAEMYPVPSTVDNLGESERIIGRWLKSRSNRDQVIIASKICGPSSQLQHIRNGELSLNHANIVNALELSLKRLKTDYIDLYYLHWPSRLTNNFGRLDYSYREENIDSNFLEILETLNNLVDQGKIRSIGVSNETPWGLSSYLSHIKNLNMTPIVAIQNPYSLLNRSFEIGLAEFSHRESVGLMAYSPLGFGVLTGKYLDGRKPIDSRRNLYPRNDRYSNNNGIEATQAYVELAKKIGIEPTDLALSFVNNQPFVTSTIIAASKITQLQSNINSINIELSDEVISEINSIHQKYTNPCP